MTLTLMIILISWQKNAVSDSQNNQFYKIDLDLDPMKLILKLDLDIVKTHHRTRNEVSMSRHLKVRTDKETE